MPKLTTKLSRAELALVAVILISRSDITILTEQDLFDAVESAVEIGEIIEKIVLTREDG